LEDVLGDTLSKALALRWVADGQVEDNDFAV
jgi:hypothetical protein